MECKRDFLYKKLQELDKTRNKLEQDIEKTVEKITRADRRITEPKIYYLPLDEYYTAEEFIELEAFFEKKLTNLPSTDLTSIC